VASHPHRQHPNDDNHNANADNVFAHGAPPSRLSRIPILVTLRRRPWQSGMLRLSSAHKNGFSSPKNAEALQMSALTGLIRRCCPLS
jgi:hypothetical protein